MAEPDPTIPAGKFRRKTTVYSTKADKEVLAKLQSLTGLRQSQTSSRVDQSKHHSKEAKREDKHRESNSRKLKEIKVIVR